MHQVPLFVFLFSASTPSPAVRPPRSMRAVGRSRASPRVRGRGEAPGRPTAAGALRTTRFATPRRPPPPARAQGSPRGRALAARPQPRHPKSVRSSHSLLSPEGAAGVRPAANLFRRDPSARRCSAFTAPGRLPTISATCSTVRSPMMRSTMTSRWSGGRPSSSALAEASARLPIASCSALALRRGSASSSHSRGCRRSSVDAAHRRGDDRRS